MVVVTVAGQAPQDPVEHGTINLNYYLYLPLTVNEFTLKVLFLFNKLNNQSA
jgi:hypothetical protein